ncbi:coenzyme F420-0:L-glutamate ligase [Patescibacteria group bacterium]|nr:coenzyme F420-0:L-glutamate ligase [Patescibacteria group bacterium]
MKITPIQTKPISPHDPPDLLTTIDNFLPNLKERSIVAITSKIISICEGRYVKINPSDNHQKENLVHQEADCYLPSSHSQYNISLTIKNKHLIPMSGIDESNSDGHYILWPANLQKTADQIWRHLRQKNNIKMLGIIITDSTVAPLQWGTHGICIAHCGFNTLNDYIDQADIFGHKMSITKANIAHGLAATAVLVMGEGNEQTPMALITDTPFIKFQNQPPTIQKLESLQIEIKDDLYAPLLQSVPWTKLPK